MGSTAIRKSRGEQIADSIRVFGPQVVYCDRSGRLRWCLANGQSHRALENERGWSRRCAGVFDASASPDLIEAEVVDLLRGVR